jgi:hypothetical protein
MVARLVICALLALYAASPASAAEDLRVGDRVIPGWMIEGLEDSFKDVVKGRYTSVGNLGLSFSNLGYFGNLLNPTVAWPSLEYPLNSNVEHMFLGGPWVGAISAEGDTLVSAGAEDTGASTTTPKQEFGPRNEDKLRVLSSNPLSPFFSTSALADQHFELVYDDYSAIGGGGNDEENQHFPLGVRMHVKVLAYAPPYADDFVILDFEVENISGTELSDLYLGWYNELTVGNINVTVPGGTPSWNFYDDYNGYVGPGDSAEDPEIHLMYCHDDDGEEGRATSWIGVRLLGTDTPGPVFSYRQWRFGDVPRNDRLKYEYMASNQLDVGSGDENYTNPGNWISMIAVGPWPDFFPDDKAHFTIAMVAGSDSTAMLRNSQIAQATFDRGFELPAGPPSPRLSVTTEENRVILRWDPGQDPGDGPYDPALASPEYHRSDFTNEYDFQGYRIYRFQGESLTGDPFEVSSLLAEFDRTQWPDGTPDDVGFNAGLPPLNQDGQREFVDENVLNGVTYWYAVTSYASRNPRLGLPELESGFNENSMQVVPGSGPARAGGPRVGVYPNPYRAVSLFDTIDPNTGQPFELQRSIYFTNVPASATIEIYNLSGARIDRLERRDASTGQVEWDMVSENTRAIASGLYIYVVRNDDTGEIQRGKLVILK